MRRVLILGCPGSGKSTLARRLAAATGLPLVHLDQLYWRSGWVEPTPDEWLPSQLAALSQPEWIMDGNYGSTLALRLQSADTVILLDYPTHICLARALRRMISGWGKDRPDNSPGCPERFDPAFLRYIVRFRANKLPGIRRRLQGFAGKVLLITCSAEAERLLAQVAEQANVCSGQ